MKFKQVAIVDREDGYEVSIIALLARGEDVTALGIADALASITGLGSRDTAPSEAETIEVLSQVDAALGELEFADKAGEVAAETLRREAEPQQPETRRRRHRNPLEEAAPEATESPTESPRRRRRAASTSESPAPLQSPAAPTDASSSVGEGQSDANPTRRRRRGADAPSADTSPSSDAPKDAEPATASEGVRRRRRVSETPSSPSAAASPSDDKITDADLSKACSDAARVLAPKVVMEYLGTFGVRSAGELKAADRRRFLDGLKAKKEAA